MINLTLERLYRKDTYTIGKFYLNGNYFCDTLEDTDRDLNKDGDLNDPGEGKVMGETAIPYGRYRVVVTMSPKFKRLLPLVMDVWGFTGIRIHRGRYNTHTAGCVLVGENKIKGGLINSKEHEENLTRILYDYQKVGKLIYINIT